MKKSSKKFIPFVPNEIPDKYKEITKESFREHDKGCGGNWNCSCGASYFNDGVIGLASGKLVFVNDKLVDNNE